MGIVWAFQQFKHAVRGYSRTVLKHGQKGKLQRRVLATHRWSIGPFA
jgi:hypothetical protein